MLKNISNGLKRFLATLILALALPLTSYAALSLPHNPPLQTIPGATHPNFSNNANSDGSSFNNSENQIQQQTPSEENPGAVSETPATTPGDILSVAKASPAFYIILIVVCSLSLLIMFVWLIIKYRKKT